MMASKGRAKGTNRLPLLAQAGPVSIWMIVFVTIPMLFIIFISFMTRGTFGGVEYTPSLESYQTMMEVTWRCGRNYDCMFDRRLSVCLLYCS